MSSLDDPDIKRVYDKCKYIVKIWEIKFKKKNKRNPSKLDFKEAPQEVRNAYNYYYKLKSQAIEESFQDVELFAEEEDIVDNAITELQLSNDNFTIEPERSPTPELVEEENVWGSHLNKLQLPEPDKEPEKALSEPVEKITKKLFCGSKFNKRNPRKSMSLSQKKSQLDSTPNTSQCEPQFADFKSEEAIEFLKNDLEPYTIPMNIIDSVINKNVTRKVDTGWLKRAIDQSGITLQKTETDSDSDIVQSSEEDSPKLHLKKKFRFSEIKENHVNHINQPSTTISPEVEKLVTPPKKPLIERPKRTTLVEGSLRESCSEEDPFASDNDDKDPEFTMRQKKKTFFMIDDVPKKKSPKVAKATKTLKVKKKKKSPEKKEEADMDYEMEYNVKPRLLTPRYSSIRNALVDKLQLPDSETPKDKVTQQQDKLQQKISSGTLNDNFVTINLRKKVFARGKRSFNFAKYKKQQWKNKKKSLSGPDMDMGGCDGGKLVCFKCGLEGHFAQRCKNTGDTLLPVQAEEEEECQYLTLEEAQQMAMESKEQVRKPKITRHSSSDEDDDLDEILMAEADKLEQQLKQLNVDEYLDKIKTVSPLENFQQSDLYEALQLFGHTSFRPGQKKAVSRILAGKSTLVTLSTGSGKSLCYQLPAYLYSRREPCISLVISPLVSLMEDQVTGIPKFLKAACLHHNQTDTQRKKIMDAISMGELQILLVSPEAVVAGEKKTGFGSLLRKLPPIAFACIDEAHCVSQWSHNFRPSYLMICRVLRESLGVKTILGLTATATKATCQSIIDSLSIPDGFEGIISDTPLPDNLFLTVSKDTHRDRALLNLLLSDRFKGCKSVIVYCTRREECERIAGFLRTSLRDDGKVEGGNVKKRKRLNLQAEPYHAGLSASKRRSVQNAFMSGDLRIVVATVAFGMGINKSDIRAVIHFNMPNSFESYVQEVGRAGRDGLPAHCHLFLDSQGRDEQELRRHIHANSLDRYQLRKLLQKIFLPCSCPPKSPCPKHELAVPIDQTILNLDVAKENIETLLCYLELHPKKYIELLSPCYTMCKVLTYGSHGLHLKRAAKGCPPLAMALALYPPNEDKALEFPVVEVASAMGWYSSICKQQLKNLEWNGANKRSPISVQFSGLGFHVLAPGNLCDEELDEALDSLFERVREQEDKALKQLHIVHKTMINVAENSYISCLDVENQDKIVNLKKQIREYFANEDPLKHIELRKPGKINEEQLICDIRAIICMYRDNQFTGKAIARIFHGIQSPNYPAVIWGRCKFWRSHLNEDFYDICRVATREVLKMR